MSKPKRKQPPPYFYSGEHEAKGEEKQEDAEDTIDIYDNEQRDRMLDQDEVTAAEEGFMRGREEEPPSKKETRRHAISHDDTTAVELAKEDSEED